MCAARQPGHRHSLNALVALIGGRSKHQHFARPAVAPHRKLVLHRGQTLSPAELALRGGGSVTRIAILLHGFTQQYHLFAEIAAGRAHAQVRPQADTLTQAEFAILGLGQRAGCLLAIEHEGHGI